VRGTAMRSTADSVVSGSLWRLAFTRPGAESGRSAGRRYGEPADPDGDGVAVPEGFTVRVVARSGERIGGVAWHAAPDEAGCLACDDGWIYVSNSARPLLGGVTAVRFTAGGEVVSAYRLLSGTDRNHAGAVTPWRTWLSGEETPYGRIFECDPYGMRAAMPRLAMGRFRHGGLAVDPDRGIVYLTELEPDGCFYRFRPEDWGDLTSGVLEVMVTDGESVSWRRVHTPAAIDEPLREQVPGARRFAVGSAVHCHGGICYFATVGDGRIWAYDPERERLTVVYGDGAAHPGTLHENLFVAEDDGARISVVSEEGTAAPFLRLEGAADRRITGLAFAPDHSRLYFSVLPARPGAAGSAEAGVTYEVRGPFLG